MDSRFLRQFLNINNTMFSFSEIKQFFSKKTSLIFVLILFLVFQFIFSFLSPSVGDNENWLPVGSYTPKYSLESFDGFLLEKISPLFLNYRINSDVGPYLEVADGFSLEQFEKNRNLINRPIYSFLIFLFSLPLRLFGLSSFGLLFGLAVLINFIFLTGAVILFFKLLCKMFSKRIAFLSSFLFIFSPFVHSYSTQALPEMLNAFFVVCSFYFLYNYWNHPSKNKLVVYSFGLGIFMLNKLFFAIPLLILILAISYKRFKEGVIFLIFFSAPFLFWYLWITKIWGLQYFINEIHNWNMGIWVFDMIFWPWYEIAKTLLNSFSEFTHTLIYAFLFIPILFVVLGLKTFPEKFKNLFFVFGICIFLLGFLIDFYYRHMFMLFPFVYPVCILGIERISNWLRKYNSYIANVWYGLIIIIIIIISNINIYKIFYYDF